MTGLEAILAHIEQEAQAEAQGLLDAAQAEAQAAAWTREVLEQAQKDCEAQKAQARERLDQAAAFLAEGIVSGWQS